MNKINIKLIVGLGNPGNEYQYARHNAGFIAIDALARCFDGHGFAYNKKLFSEIAELKITGAKNKILAAKPQTFMNKSGAAVAAIIKYYHPAGNHPKGGKIKPKNILIIHDDIDILWGAYKFSFGRSSAGHKGVESVIKALKTKNFWRLRIGIQPAGKKHIPADKIILKKFTPAELKALNKVFKEALSEIIGK